MKFVTVLASMFFLVACSTQPGTSRRPEFDNFLPQTAIVYSANTNGEIEPCGCRQNPTGGIHRRWNILEQKIPGEKLSIDSGDLFYKSTPVPPFLESQWNYQAEVLVKAYNAMKVEVMTPGELDFAAGLVQFDKLRSMAQFKMISSNLYLKASNKLLLEPSVILTKSSKRVGIFAVYDPELALPDGVYATDVVEAARKAVAELKPKSDLIIALTHIGIDNDRKLAREVGGITAIFGAHTQSFLTVPEKVNDTIIFQTSFRGQHLAVFESAKNGMYQVDARFDSPADKPNAMDLLIAEAKKKVGSLNRDLEAELLSGPDTGNAKIEKKFQTFVGCADCHFKQHQFHRETPHFRAYETLVKANQNANLDCLKCHTVGMQQPGGWNNVNKLVITPSGKTIDAASFAKSAPRMSAEALGKVSKAFINVQCETCHGAAGEHPFSGKYSKQVSSQTCLQCHTPDQAPKWYKNGKPDEAVIKAKLKSMSCPSMQKSK